MGDVKVTKIKIKVNLKCEKSKKKIKKVLCKIPQIQSQEYDVQNNCVTVTVVCCSPEKITQKICCKVCDIILGIEIVPPPPPPPPPPPTTPPPPCYNPYCGGWGSCCRRVYVSICSDYICEENPTACTIM